MLRSILIFCCCLCSTLLAEELGPGTHMITTDENPAVKYRLIIPESYDSDAPHGAPLFISMVTAEGSGTFGVEKWGAKFGVLTIGVYNDGKGNGNLDGAEMHRICVRDVSKKLKVHPNLRFTIGISASSAKGMRIASADGDHYAGCIMQAHSGDVSKLASHIVVTFAHGENDKTHEISFAKKNAETLRRRGNPVMTYWHNGGHNSIDKAHKEEGYAALNRMRDWMFWTAKLTHPKLSPQERTYYAEELAASIQKRTEGKTIDEVNKVIDGVKTIEAAFKNRDLLLAMAEAKAAALWKGYEESATNVDKVCALVEVLGEPMIKGHAKQKEAKAALRALEKEDRSLKKESQAWQKYISIRYQELNRDPVDMKTLKACVGGYVNLAKRSEGTKGGQKAAEAVERLRAEFAPSFIN